jgi:hypothetical protein
MDITEMPFIRNKYMQKSSKSNILFAKKASIVTPVRDKKSQIKVGNLAIYLYLYS